MVILLMKMMMANVAHDLDFAKSGSASRDKIVEASFPGSMITGCWIFEPDE